MQHHQESACFMTAPVRLASLATFQSTVSCQAVCDLHEVECYSKLECLHDNSQQLLEELSQRADVLQICCPC